MTTTLVKCADCGKDISRRAAACPHCGAPLREPPAAAAPTGKFWKALIVSGLILIAYGVVAELGVFGTTPMVGGQPLGYWIVAGGAAVSLGGGFGAWWNHG